MTAMPMPVTDPSNQQARAWFDERHEELLSRARFTFRYLNADRREEAVVEAMNDRAKVTHLDRFRLWRGPPPVAWEEP